MLALSTILVRLAKHEDLLEKLSYQTLDHFFKTMFRYMPRVVTTAPRRTRGVPPIDAALRNLLALTLQLSYEDVDKLWGITGDLLVKEFEALHKLGKPPGLDDRLNKVAPQFGLGCNTTYRPNYYVQNADSISSVRHYYEEVPNFLEVTQHSYVEEELVQLFRHQMAFSQ
ncbi:hypothetical protein GSI_12385 [Ganoderma sinense ZZ0214-1]|uniref:CxC5 like cysteine cluster associated with KDZ domain-containing protein n=1 Tax=Ganoderma sinense ZZ0214-1 TaxID=1077348 RepID=A0A2G8RVL8_9APHY|nr:hypothetical protein GSI_12385 [Ganoderma sinense ZZ0214-1]